MKVIIRELAWLPLAQLDPRDHHVLTNAMTIVPKGTSAFNPNPTPIRLYAQTEKWLGIPIAAWREQKKLFDRHEIEEVWQISSGQPLRSTTSDITLREEDQEPAVETMVQHLQTGHCNEGLLCAYTGFGKSVAGLEIIRRLGRSAIILLHRDSLLQQWKRNIQNHWPGASIGTVAGPTVDFEGKDIVLAMVQSLMYDGGKKYPAHFWSYFGTMFVDEVHVFGASKFGSVAPRFNCRHRIGVSGTIRRMDKCEKVFKSVLGDIVYTASEKNRVNPDIYIRNTGFRAPPDKEEEFQNFQKPTLLTIISKNKRRCKMIADDVLKAYKAGRHPLLMSERLSCFPMIQLMIDEMCAAQGIPRPSHGYYVGGRQEHELIAASQCQIVYTTYQLAKEGIDIPRLDVLFLVTPISDSEQSIGRVCRSLDGKSKPLVMDYVDYEIDRFRHSFHARFRLYQKLTWTVFGVADEGATTG